MANEWIWFILIFLVLIFLMLVLMALIKKAKRSNQEANSQNVVPLPAPAPLPPVSPIQTPTMPLTLNPIELDDMYVDNNTDAHINTTNDMLTMTGSNQPVSTSINENINPNLLYYNQKFKLIGLDLMLADVPNQGVQMVPINSEQINKSTDTTIRFIPVNKDTQSIDYGQLVQIQFVHTGQLITIDRNYQHTGHQSLLLTVDSTDPATNWYIDGTGHLTKYNYLKLRRPKYNRFVVIAENEDENFSIPVLSGKGNRWVEFSLQVVND